MSQARNSAEMPRYRCHKEVWALKIAEVQKVTPPDFKGVVCRGSLVLGSACGKCERCKWEQEYGPWRTKILLIFSDPGYAPIEVDFAWAQKHEPKAGGYYVAYKDGYKSFSPAEAFEEGYARC